ncbi:Transcriptional regulatory protein TyrR, partial [Haemophilus influenzae]
RKFKSCSATKCSNFFG